jgi:hypothetical protein
MATTPKIKFDYNAKIDDFKRAWTDAEKKIAHAGTAAIREVGDLAVTRGRAQLGARGFKDGYFPWQKAFKAEMFPRSGKDSLRAAVRVRHGIGIVSVFELETVTKPRTKSHMWLPLTDNLPAGWQRGGVRSGPKNFTGKLWRVNREGRAPLLVGKPAGAKKNVPLFVGIKTAKMPRRLNLYGIIKEAAAQLSALYNKHFRDDNLLGG